MHVHVFTCTLAFGSGRRAALPLAPFSDSVIKHNTGSITILSWNSAIKHTSIAMLHFIAGILRTQGRRKPLSGLAAPQEDSAREAPLDPWPSPNVFAFHTHSHTHIHTRARARTYAHHLKGAAHAAAGPVVPCYHNSFRTLLFCQMGYNPHYPGSLLSRYRI